MSLCTTPTSKQVGLAPAKLASARPGQDETDPSRLYQLVHLVEQSGDLLDLINGADGAFMRAHVSQDLPTNLPGLFGVTQKLSLRKQVDIEVIFG
jgi:hypothetical protein